MPVWIEILSIFSSEVEESRYLFIASMDIEADREKLFNEVYDEEHVPNLLKVPGVLSIARFQMRELTLLKTAKIER